MKNFFKNSKIKLLILVTISFLILPLNAFAYSKRVIPGGESVGIQIHSKGVIIVGTYNVNGVSPGEDANLKVGDIILKINGTKIDTIKDMVNHLSGDKELKLTYSRDGKEYNTILKPIKSKDDNSYKTGLYIRDSISGIGTVTFYDPDTRRYGALGHEIMDRETRQIIDISKGKIFKSVITSIDKSERGNPGEKNASLKVDQIYGNIDRNTPFGIFGNYFRIPDRKLMEVADINEVKLGRATMLTVLENNKIEEFEIQIVKIYAKRSNDTKGLLIEITDKRLLDKTGGIIQGMSGSPIIQNGKLVGAVTHVMIDDVTKGYGIFAKWMVEQSSK